MSYVDFLTARRAVLGVEQMLHPTLSVQEVGAWQANDVGVCLDVHETSHTSEWDGEYMFSLKS